MNDQSTYRSQFADDTILVGEGSWQNLWTIEPILRGFEMVSGLRINLCKSKTYGIGVNDHFKQASQFLLCCIYKIPFKFLGIHVDSNPRRCDCLRPVVEGIRRKISTWRGRFLSTGQESPY